MKQIIDHLLEGLNLEKNLTDDEMSRMIRFLLALEDETFQLYIHLMNSTDNPKISTVFQDIAEERRFQVSQLTQLLGELGMEKNRMLH
jgi:rubrerythrin